MAFKTISKNGADGDQFKFEEEGTVLEGYYLGMTFIPIKGKDVPRYSFKVGDKVITTLGSKNLNEGMEDAVQGAMTRVTFVELHETKAGNDFKRFTIEQDTDDMYTGPLPTAAPASTSGSTSAASAHSANVASKAAELKSGGQLGKTVS